MCPFRKWTSPASGGSDHVVGEQPEMRLAPHLRDGLIFRQSDDGRHRRRIAAEVGDRRDQQSERSWRVQNINHNQLVRAVRDRARNRHLRQVEYQLDQLHPPRRLPIELRQRAGQSDHQRLGQTQFQDSQQGEQEVDRERPFNAGQAYLQRRRQQPPRSDSK